MTVDAASATQERDDTPVSHEGEQGAAPEQRDQQEQPEQSQSEAAKPQRAKTKSSARKTRTVVLTLTVTGTADGEWQAELKHGSKWVAKGLGIPASAVSRAARELHEELSAPIDQVINEAREQQRAKVAQLEAELEQAKQALAELQR
ncbi:DUF6319 family protein [Saccharomonospora glauca]|jgi:hypothetical protein|uniref:Uncharacterized protein n=1 Tax=Saccharomonospora glauca K62 TaxID=928724 RepID=I1D7B1_9PSEU|nr:DUF6319 family protein [Saccharomonospora glauca]EIF00836.1 hypothetical protein SacglDRAFT_03994 [Saccharomonospora glauca K62]